MYYKRACANSGGRRRKRTSRHTKKAKTLGGRRRRGKGFKEVLGKIGQVALHALPFVAAALGRKRKARGINNIPVV